MCSGPDFNGYPLHLFTRIIRHEKRRILNNSIPGRHVTRKVTYRLDFLLLEKSPEERGEVSGSVTLENDVL